MQRSTLNTWAEVENATTWEMNLDKWRNKPNANTSDGDLVNKDEETLQLST